MAISESKVDTFISAICKPGYRLEGEARAKALSFIEVLPLTDEHLEALRNSKVDELVKAAEDKHEQRRDDFVLTLFDAVDAGCQDLNGVAEWLGIDADSSYSGLLSRGHAYRRLGTPGRPETVPVS